MVHIISKNSLISGNRGIIPSCLPLHTTHILQPLDVVVFQPYKHFHAEAIDVATRTGCSDFNKLEFLTAPTSIHEQTFKKTTVLSAFRQTGLILFKLEIVLSKLNKPVSWLGSIPSLNTRPQCCLPFSHQVRLQTHLPAILSLQVQ